MKYKFLSTALLLFFCFLNPNPSKAQLFRPYEVEFSHFLDYTNKQEPSALLNKINTHFTVLYTKPTPRRSNCTTYKVQFKSNPNQEAFIIFNQDSSKVERIDLLVDLAELAENFPYFDKKYPGATARALKHFKLLDDVIYKHNKKLVMGYYPNSDLLVKLDYTSDNLIIKIGTSEKLIREYKYAKRNGSKIDRLTNAAIRSYMRREASIALSNRSDQEEICANALFNAPPDIFTAPELPRGGKCLFNCEKTGVDQIWHYGNAIYVGRVKDGLPHTEKRPNSKYHHDSELYVFDTEDCQLDARNIKNCKIYYHLHFTEGKASDWAVIKFNADNLSSQGSYGKYFFEEGKATAAKRYFLNDDFELVSPAKPKARYVYEGKINNGLPEANKAKIYDVEKKKDYWTAIKNGKPNWKSVIIYSAKSGRTAKNSTLESKQYEYAGEVNENFVPSGRGTQYYEGGRYDKEKGVLSKWRVRGTWREDGTLDLDQPIFLTDLINKQYWRATDGYVDISGNEIKIKGVFDVSNDLFFNTYSTGKFITGKIPTNKMPIPIPDGLHRQIKVTNGIKEVVAEQFYDKGLHFSGTDFYTYSLLNKYQSQQLNRIARAKERYEEKKRKQQQSLAANKTCPVCAGSGKTFITNTETVKESKFSEDESYFHKTTTERQVEMHRRVKCGRCAGTGKVQ
ncbi:MAG: hypothetical protein AAF573_17955 [Bacteroidota bacterium]